LSNKPIFLFHWLASPDCNHLYLHDETNVPYQTSHQKTLNAATLNNNTLGETPKTHDESLMQKAGFMRISTLRIPLYVCPSCQGHYEAWTTLVYPWKSHAQHFPYCPHVLKIKSPSFILACLNQYKNSTGPRHRYNHFFQHHLQYIRPDTFCTDLLKVSNKGTSDHLLQNLTKHHVLFMNNLLCYAKPMTDPPA